jgi:hypothetical protein
MKWHSGMLGEECFFILCLCRSDQVRVNPTKKMKMTRLGKIVAQTVLSAVSQVGNLRTMYRPRTPPAFAPCRLPVGDTADNKD